jgi:hypothetical protein
MAGKTDLIENERAETRIVNVPPSPFALTCEDAWRPEPYGVGENGRCEWHG